MKVYVIIGVWQGCLQDVSIRTRRKEALKKRDALMKQYDLTEDDKPDKAPGAHSLDCRWNDEKEVHMHEMNLRVRSPSGTVEFTKADVQGDSEDD